MNQDVSKITVPSGTYNLKDAKARADIATNTNDISALETKVTTNTNDISALETKVTTNTNDISGLETKVTTNTNDINALETKVDGIQSSVDDFNNWNISYADETLTFTSVTGG